MQLMDQRPLALVGSTLIDGSGGSALPDSVIIIERERISAVGQRSQLRVPDGIEPKNVDHLTILPGLIDSHVHISFALGREPPKGPTAEKIIDEVLRAFLQHGVTTIRDLGGAYPWIIEVAESIEKKHRKGPRVVAAGPMLTAPGGHPAGTLLRGREPAIAVSTRQIASREDARKAVHDLQVGGVAVIKAVLDSRGRAYSPDRVPTLNSDILAAITEQARSLGLPVTVHWGNVDELPAVVSCGTPQIEHSGHTPIPSRIIEDIARARIAVDPTLTMMQARSSSEDAFNRGALANVRRLHEAGIVITAGTDSPLGELRFGESLHSELELLVKAGMSPIEAIQAATSRPAKLMKLDHEIGTVQSGKRADLIGIAGDPLRDISNIRNIKLVVRNGCIVEEN
jgi:imidazolonepropionase-like amidohydrolase